MKARALLAGLLATASLSLLPQAAAARYDPLASGTTRLTLDRSLLALLAGNGAEVSAVAPATLKGRVLSFPVAGGKFDPTNGRGIVDHEGALLFKAGKRSVPLKDLQLKPTRRSSPFTVKAGGGQLKLATATKVSSRRIGFGDDVRASGLALSDKLAGRLSKKLRLRGVLAGGLALGTTATVANPESVTIEARERASLSFDPSFLAKLQGLFVALNPIFPAEHLSTDFTLPIAGGRIAPDASLGTLETAGAIEALQLGGGQVFWQTTWLDLGARTALPMVEVQPSPPYAGKLDRIAIADLDLTAATVASDPKSRTIAVAGVSLALQAQTAATFNEVFARPQGKDGIFQPGEKLGTISFTARGQ